MPKTIKRKLQQIASNNLSDIEFKDFKKVFKYFSNETLLFLMNDTTLPLDNPLRFRKNLL